MTWHLYLAPIIGSGQPIIDPRRPKYFDTINNHFMQDYGFQQTCLVSSDVDNATDSSLNSQPDVMRIPDLASSTVGGGGVNRVKNALESQFIPGQWVVASTTYSTVARFVLNGDFKLLAKYAANTGITTPLIDGTTITLSTTFGSLPANTQSALISAAQACGFNTSTFIPANTLRTIWTDVGNQGSVIPFTLGGITI